MVKEIVKVLIKNRKILNSYLTYNAVIVSIVELKRNGFQFGFFTNLDVTECGKVICYCFEIGYEYSSMNSITILPIAS